MPVPMEYRLASQDFDRFLAEVAEATGLATRNQAYTTTQAVLQTFRRRLDTAQAIAFAQGLPAMLRAFFVMDWNPQEPRMTGWDRDAMSEEVRRLRIDHNFSPDSAIADVARVLRSHVDASAFARGLAALPPEARAFWSAK
jgi:uncharacterized protein (DUF2267 family)